MNLTSITSQAVATMSSIEIAELTGSRHDNVVVSIERCVKDGAIVQPALKVVSRKDKMGRDRTINTYVFSGEQGKAEFVQEGYLDYVLSLVKGLTQVTDLTHIHFN